MSIKDRINHYFTDNKLKVIYAVDDTAKLISLHLFIRVGSVFEQETEAGYSHFLEHLVFKSTEHFPHNTLMDAASNYGGVLNAYTEYESTCFYLTLPAEYLSQGLQLLSEIAYRANFSDKEFGCEKQVVLEELKQYQNDPEESLIEGIPEIVSLQSPYTKKIIGNKNTLLKAKPDYLRAFYKKYYTPQNAFLCVAGDFKINDLKKSIDKWFRDFKPSQNQLPIPSYPLPLTTYPSPQNIHHIKKKLSHCLLAFVLPELSDNHPLSNAAHLIAKAFCIGKNSRLYQRLYLAEQLVDNIKVNSISGLYDGVMIVLIHPRKSADLEKIIEIFIEEYREISRLGVKSVEIDYIKKELITGANYVFEYMEVLASSLGNEELLGDYRTFFDYEKDIASINKDDIKKALTECYDIEKLHIIKAGGEKLGKRNAECGLMDASINLPLGKGQGGSKAVSSSPNITNYRLSSVNPLNILLKKTPNKPICGVSLALRVSQLDEDETNLGLNQLTASSMLYGNERRDYQQCLQYCSVNGIQFAVSCGKETTKLRFKCFADNLLETLQFLCDVLTTPTFPIEHIKNLQETFIGNIERIKDYPQNEAVHLWKQMIFGRCSNVLSKDGTVKSLNSFNRKKVIDWYNDRVLHSPATLCIVGDFEEDDVRYTIDKLFSHLTFSSESNHRPIFISPSNKNKIIKNKRLDQSIINLGGFCMPGKDIQYRAAMSVLAQIIGGEISSRMFDLLREKHAIAYSAEFDFDLLSDLGYYDMFTIVDKEQEKLAIELLYKMINDIKENGVTTEELNRAKNFICGQMRLDEESVLSQAQVISSLLTLGADYSYYLERENRVKQVNPDMISHIINEYFNPEDQYLHILH